MTTIKPVAEYVLFKQVITKNASGIILPESAKDADLCKNVVRDVGDDTQAHDQLLQHVKTKQSS